MVSRGMSLADRTARIRIELNVGRRPALCSVLAFEQACVLNGRNVHKDVPANCLLGRSKSTGGAMKSAILECALVLMAFAVLDETALARSYLNCITKKLTIVDAPKGATSSSIEENFGF